ncbi:proline dehydrogenase family protein [Perlabentimonas gracilis]|uniref:proline dehydrogenase family protein n=1 Tax=Perlabentimonas gracilis TaxID=2715279 RepID=UPI00140909C2|nr:proline dehydrogenase family protein [Perlabentimonas gracilis]NHB70045.1 proline dehydrogenase [Perlabentimonas gracilis]
MHTFNNTEIAFAWRNNKELRKAHFLFRTIALPWLVNLGSLLLRIALTIRFPIGWLVKPTIFSHFVGGETLAESVPTVNTLAQFGVKSILDYSVEGKGTAKSQEEAYTEILNSIHNAASSPSITFSVFKPTGLINVDILEKVTQGMSLTIEETEQFDLFKQRVHTLCHTSVKANTPILIDAEDSWYQKALDEVVRDMMAEFNKEQVFVYNTLQMYRTDRLTFLKEAYRDAKENGFKLGMKFVRGAYMEKERERAQKLGYPSPIHPTKEDTDQAFNDGQEFAFNHLDTISIFCGTHNEESVNRLCLLMQKGGVSKNDKRITFSQLLGMSDNISFMLGHLGYNVTKYIPYGPVREVMPYLIRRAQENTSVKGQTGRELSLIEQELKRRKSKS